jgi:hypothetical protein
MPLDKAVPALLKIGGEVEEKWWKPGAYRWTNPFNLTALNEAFYRATAPEQFRHIE